MSLSVVTPSLQGSARRKRLGWDQWSQWSRAASPVPGRLHPTFPRGGIVVKHVAGLRPCEDSAMVGRIRRPVDAMLFTPS